MFDRNHYGLSPLEYAAKYSGFRYLTMLMEEEGLLKKTVASFSKNNFSVRSNAFDEAGTSSEQDLDRGKTTTSEKGDC